jgi:quinoprotein dehydrogenase-associated probable ABC transporter substrate-binding protein
MSSVSSTALIAAFAAVIAAPVAIATTHAMRPRDVVHLSAPAMTVREIAPDPQALRVCADPNNLPFSNQAKEGFENRLADMIASKLDKPLAYVWWAQRRGFIRHTLKAGDCDLVIGVPAHYDLVETTKPYYRSTYVFVTRTDRHLDLASMVDPRLAQLNIGVHLTGNDGNNPPPAEALGEQGIVDNVHGYMLYGDYRQPNPPARLIDAVANGEIDVAAAWGPLAGYFASRSSTPLTVTPIVDGERFAPQRFIFDIAMGVRKGDDGLRDQLNAFIDDDRAEIMSLLKSYGVPLMDVVRGASGEHR